MNTLRFERLMTQFWRALIILCLFVVNVGLIPQAQRVQAAPSGCSGIYNGGNGWVIELCTTDPDVPTPMTVFLNGVSKGNAVLLRIYHKSQNDPGTPQVALIYSSGYVRLKQNDDPSPSIPFGTSFILGPAYWAGPSTYYHNPQLTRLDIDTTWLPDSPLRMKAVGTNHAFNVTYDMVLPPPLDRQTRLHVDQTYTATSNVNVPATKLAEKQGFKLIQASSMFISETGPCDGGYTECHDSNNVRFIANDLSRRQVAFKDLILPSFVFSAPRPLGTTWFDVLHTDDQSWQSQTGAGTSGNTPNVRIALDELPAAYPITPQGWITTTTNPNDDNVNLWLHDDRQSSGTWTAGKTDKISYWLLAQDNPPGPLAELGLRPGLAFLNFNGSHNCYLVKDTDTTGAVTPTNGYTDRALQLAYNLGSTNGNWTQIRCDFSPPLDLSAYDHLRVEWRGNRTTGNSLEVGLINPNGNIFARGYHHVTHHGWWGQMVIPFKFLDAWTTNTQFNPAQVSAFFISVVKDPADDVGGAGTIAIDNLGAYNVSSRAVPGSFETVDANPVAAQAAASWLASRQRPTGLLRSWENDPVCWSYTYDQALALIVFSKQGLWGRADALVAGLAAVQNPDGSWHQNRDCNTLAVPADSRKWEGDIAWAVYALRRYLDLGGTLPQAATALQKGANWLATRISPTNGCLVIDHTEAAIDAWWAFQAAGTNHANNAEKIKRCLLNNYWDNGLGRFKGGSNWWQPYLDNQTWGAAFLKAIGEPVKARQALSYARDVLRLPAQGGQLFGFDGQGGPWSIWNEGTAQYIAVGGDGASDLLLELLAQQQQNGAMPGSSDDFSGGGVWTTRWNGVAPTAWLYNALSGEPFHPSPKNTDVYVGAAKQGAYYLPPSARVSFPGVNAGPVKMINTNNDPLFAAERIIYKAAGGVNTSYSEMMALPDNLMDNRYWLPWYNNVGLDSQLRFANVSGSSATVHVYIGGQEMTGSPFTMAPGASARRSFAGIDRGPVEITSSQNIVVAERVIYKVNGVNTSFSEIMALPDSQLDSTYWLPWYNNLELDTQLRIANVTGSPATVHINIGGQEMTGSPFSLAPGASIRKNFPVNDGPVEIVSNQNIVAAERVIYKVNGVNTSFSEIMALPDSQLDSTYWLPWYNNTGDLDTQLRIANVSGSPATVHINIGGQEMTGSPFTLAPGASARRSYAGVDRGPVQIVSNQNLVVAERVIYKRNNIKTSFSELLALPDKLLDPIYWLPWYNNVDLDTQLRFGVP